MKAKQLLAAALLATLVISSASGPAPVRRLLTANEKLIRLIEALWEPDDLAADVAAPKLGRSADTRAVEALFRAARDPRMEVRNRAIQGLGYVHDPRATQTLLAAMRDQATQEWAARSLRRLKDPRAVDPLLELLHNSLPRIRSLAVQALGSIQEFRTFHAICSALQDQDSSVREFAVRSIGARNDPGALEALAAALGHAPEAGRALIARPEEQAVDALMAGLGNPDEKISIAALEAFSKPGNINHNHVAAEIAGQWSISLRILQDDLADGNQPFSEGAGYALIAMGAEAAVPGLVRALKQNGTDRMAQVYWNCGHPQLQTAATQWSLDNGVELLDLQIWDFPVVHWGGRDLDPVRFDPEYMYY